MCQKRRKKNSLSWSEDSEPDLEELWEPERNGSGLSVVRIPIMLQSVVFACADTSPLLDSLYWLICEYLITDVDVGCCRICWWVFLRVTHEDRALLLLRVSVNLCCFQSAGKTHIITKFAQNSVKRFLHFFFVGSLIDWKNKFTPKKQAFD